MELTIEPRLFVRINIKLCGNPTRYLIELSNCSHLIKKYMDMLDRLCVSTIK